MTKAVGDVVFYTNNAMKKLSKELEKRGIRHDAGAMGQTIWTDNCTIELHGKKLYVNELEVIPEEAIYEILAVEQS